MYSNAAQSIYFAFYARIFISLKYMKSENK